jgi:long-chain acyl-CoA synthetase
VDDDGEILTRSAGNFVGYFRDPEATAATLDADRWLHTGDIGRLDPDGNLFITDRMKDIIITAGGKNIAPSEIENRLKVSPYVREAIVLGDRRPYLVALIGIEGETVGDWAARRRISYTTYRDLSRKPEVIELIGEWVDKVNAEFSNPEKVRRFTMLTKELDHTDGELTATQKVKRRAIEAQFHDEIEALYTEAPETYEALG